MIQFAEDRKRNEISHPKTRLAASFCAAVQVRILITIEAVFVALVASNQKIITRYVRFQSKTGSDRMDSYYTMCLIMPCAAVRNQTPRTVITFVYMPPRLWLASRDRLVSEKMVIITNLRGLVQNAFIQMNKNEYSLDTAKKKLK